MLAARSCAEINLAKASLKKIDENARSLEDKLDALALLVNMYQYDEDMTQALNTCLDVLAKLGVKLPSQNAVSAIALGIELAVTGMSSSFTSDSTLMDMPFTTDSKTINIMRYVIFFCTWRRSSFSTYTVLSAPLG